MSERTHRQAQGGPLLIVVVILIIVLAGAGYFAWALLVNTKQTEQPATSVMSQLSVSASTTRLNEPMLITVYYPSENGLVAGTASVKRQLDMQSQAREVVAVILSDQRPERAAMLRDLRLREFYLDATGAAYVDLSPLTQAGVRASAWEEMLALYAVVTTLMQNFEEIKQVRFLLDGKEVQTFAGHIDTSRTFNRRMDLVKQ